MRKHVLVLCVAAGLGTAFPGTASADLLTFAGTGVNTGLSATADIQLLDATTLKVVLTNTSTSLPAYLNDVNASSNQLLTTLAFQLPGSINVTGGSAVISPGSTGPAGNLSKEWGRGSSTSGFCCDGDLYAYHDWISTTASGTVQFATGSLGGASGVGGADFGLQSTTGNSTGQNAIRNSATFTLSLSGGVPDLSFLASGAVVEYGSDATCIVGGLGPSGVPEPAAATLLALAAIGCWRRAARARPQVP